MREFLSFAVEESLAGRGGELKESVIGARVFERTADYDPRLDPIVRVEARRLRAKLKEYYEGEGANDGVRIDLPVGSYAPAIHGAGSPRAAAPVTIAVMPFEEIGEGQEDCFAAGLCQELIHTLTRAEGLRVMAWDTSRLIRTQADAPRKVDAVLEGSVRRASTRVRIAGRLVDCASGLYLWSGVYDREVRDLLGLQTELAGAIAHALRARLSGDASGAPAPPQSEGYSFYLRGRDAIGRRSEETMRRAAVFFEHAIRLDPGSPHGYAGLAEAYSLLSEYGFDPPSAAMPRARDAAARALAIDGAHAAAHATLAGLLGQEWDWSNAESHFRRAIEINPGYAIAHLWYGIDLLALLGRMEEAEVHVTAAAELSPLDPLTHATVGFLSYLMRDWEAAEEHYHRAIAMSPDSAKACSGLGRVFAAAGRYPEAMAMMERASFLSPDDLSVASVRGQILAEAGETASAEECLGRLEEASKRRHVAQIRFAFVELGLGRKDAALARLEAAVEMREPQANCIGAHPGWDRLRGDSRFAALTRRVGVQ